MGGGKKLSGAQKRKKREGERRGYEGGCGGYGAFKAWTDEVVDGLVLHHKDVFVSHVISLN